MNRVPPDRAWWPSVGAPLDRGVRPQLSSSRPDGLEEVQNAVVA